MIILIAAVIGAVFGAFRAKARKGRTADILLYAAVHAMVAALAALFVSLIAYRVLA